MLLLLFSFKPSSQTLTVLCTGNILGDFQSCGCSKNTMGGIDKLGGVLTEANKEGNILFLVGGNSFFPSYFTAHEFVTCHKLKAGLLFESLAILGPAAVLVGRRDLVHGLKFLREMEQLEKLPLLSSNLMSFRHEYLFKPYVIKEFADFKVGIFGLTGDLEHIRFGSGGSPVDRVHASLEKSEDRKYYRANSFRSARRVLKNLKEEKVHFFVLLSDLDKAEEREILEENGEIGLIISSGRVFPTDRSEEVAGKVLIRPYPRLKFLGEMVLNIGGGKSHAAYRNIPLSADAPSHPRIRKHVVDALQELDLPGICEIDPFEKEVDFAGVSKCQSCHQEQFASWKKTKHSQSSITLMNVKKANNVDCIECHNTGSPMEGFLANVQCEACHGSGLDHSADSRVPTELINETTCTKCHDPGRFPNFEYSEKINLIRCPS